MSKQRKKRMSRTRFIAPVALLAMSITAGAAQVDDLQMSVCYVVAPDGSSEFLRLETPDLNKARKMAHSHLVKNRGLPSSDAKRMIRECIPPGGRFGNPKVQEAWTDTPL